MEVRREDAGITIRHRRLVMRVVVCVAVLTGLICVPGAMALVAVVDAVAVVDPAAIDTTATVTPAVTATPVAEPVLVPAPVAPAPVVQEPVAPAPVAVAPVAVAPDAATPPPPLVDPMAVATPAAQATPDPTVPSAVTQPTPAAPQEIIFMAVQEAPAAVVGADAPAITPAAPIAASVDQVDLSTLAVAAVVVGSTLTPVKVAAEPSVITPLVVPIVQGLGAGLLLPFVSPKTFGPPPPSFGRAVDAQTAVAQPVQTDSPAQATHVAADLPFGFAAPPGGWTGEGAGILALLMGFLPLGVPDGKSSLTHQTQAALILIGALLMVLPFFASPLRDRRRRGPRGFATLALRPG